jgi:hypothetical protein
MGYERTIVNNLTCPRPQTHFPGCKRANETKPGLQNHNADCNQVHATEPHISHPLPLQKKACINQHQPEMTKATNNTCVISITSAAKEYSVLKSIKPPNAPVWGLSTADHSTNRSSISTCRAFASAFSTLAEPVLLPASIWLI